MLQSIKTNKHDIIFTGNESDIAYRICSMKHLCLYKSETWFLNGIIKGEIANSLHEEDKEKKSEVVRATGY